jgi:hypothetical protein
MSENMTRHDLDQLRKRGYEPLYGQGGFVHWVRQSTGLPVPIEELAAALMAAQPGGLSWAMPRLNAAGRLALGDH